MHELDTPEGDRAALTPFESIPETTQDFASNLDIERTRVPGRELLVLESYRDEREARGAGSGAMAESLVSILERFLADLGRAGGG